MAKRRNLYFEDHLWIHSTYYVIWIPNWCHSWYIFLPTDRHYKCLSSFWSEYLKDDVFHIRRVRPQSSRITVMNIKSSMYVVVQSICSLISNLWSQPDIFLGFGTSKKYRVASTLFFSESGPYFFCLYSQTWQ